jgi:hypothetical protein
VPGKEHQACRFDQTPNFLFRAMENSLQRRACVDGRDRRTSKSCFMRAALLYAAHHRTRRQSYRRLQADVVKTKCKAQVRVVHQHGKTALFLARRKATGN